MGALEAEVAPMKKGCFAVYLGIIPCENTVYTFRKGYH